MSEHPNPNTAEKAEQARRQRDGDPPSGTVRVRVARDTAVALGDEVHEAGSSFTAPVAAVENAIARGLVEKVEKPKR